MPRLWRCFATADWLPEARTSVYRCWNWLEYEAINRSTLEEGLQREKEQADEERSERIEALQRAEALRLELKEACLSWWKKFLGSIGLNPLI